MAAMTGAGASPRAAQLMNVLRSLTAKSVLARGRADTIIGCEHRQAIVSLVERTSKLSRLAKVRRNTADLVGQAITTQLASLTVKTITSDNGREFAQHQDSAGQLKADFYFAHPYSSWERGLNENTNGLVRQYFPNMTLPRSPTKQLTG